MTQETKVVWNLFTKFDETQMKEQGVALAAQIDAITKLEIEKKAVNAAMTDRLNEMQSVKIRLAQEIREGGCISPVECLVKFNDPSSGMKSVYRTDNGELYSKERMSDEERQENLFPGEKEPPKTKKAAAGK